VKGFDDLIIAWSHVKDATLRIAGDGPERERLEALINQYNLQDRITLLGHRNDIRDLLQASDLLVISSHREGASIVFAEALSCSRPVVSTDCGIMSELLPPTLLVPVNTPSVLAEKINAALADLPACSASLTPLYERCRHDMTVETMTAKTVEVYIAI
jgi:glycosyltransferase involved in cell wall biosynthesis